MNMNSRPWTIESVLAEILANQLHRIRANYKGTLEGYDPEYLHDLRVAIRRSRFALKFFAPFVGGEECYKIRESLGVLNSRTGEVRDLDISIARLKEMFIKGRTEDNVRSELFRELAVRHKDARKCMLNELTSLRYRETIRSINDFIKELKETRSKMYKDKDIDNIFGKLTKKHSNKLMKWGRWKVKKLSEKDLHKMRIDFKRARYLMEFILICRAAQADFKRDIAILVSFQDVLGKHHDALTVISNIKKIQKNIGLDKVQIGDIIKSEKIRAKESREELRNKWQWLRNILSKDKS